MPWPARNARYGCEHVEVECVPALAERRQRGCDRSRHQRSLVQTLSSRSDEAVEQLR